MNVTKPFTISRWQVMDAYLKVQSNGGSAGVDAMSLKEFANNERQLLYQLWNRMSSGSYMPPAVKLVEIEKKEGGKRPLGIPTVSDRIAQTVVRNMLEPILDPLFHEDSYGYRPNKSAIQAISVARKRCWRYNWVVDLDIKGFFDNIPHDLLMKAVRKHTDNRWVLLYIERWLTAPLQLSDGTLVARTKGTPQGSVISPLLANLYLHYCLDQWLAIKSFGCKFERYADDIIIHCRTEKQAIAVKLAVKARLQQCGLEMHKEKTKLVYCKDSNRTDEVSRAAFAISFDFLGYTFKPRQAQNKERKETFTCFLPGISRKSKVSISQKIRTWNLQRWNTSTLQLIAEKINPVVRGWINYYGKFYAAELRNFLGILNKKIALWVRRKYRRFKGMKTAPIRWLRDVSKRDATLFAHWKLIGATPQVR